MQSSTAKDIAGIVGLGLGTNYLHQVNRGHPRHPDMKGGLTPRLAHTGDIKHDVAMEGGRFATNFFASILLVKLWFVYAGLTGFGMVALFHLGYLFNDAGVMGQSLPGSAYLAFGLWVVLQALYVWFWGRIFDGKRTKKSERIEVLTEPEPLPHMQTTFVNNWGEPVPVAFLPETGWIDAWGRPFSVYNQAR